MIIEFYKMLTIWDKIGVLFDVLLIVMYANYLLSKHFDKKYPVYIPPRKMRDSHISTLGYRKNVD